MIAGFFAAFLIATNATSAEIVGMCREMIPSETEISGRIILRNRKGIPQAEHKYELTRKAGVTALKLDGAEVAKGAGTDSLVGTDVTWSDLTLEYLDWNEVAFDREREGETVHGQVCQVLMLKNGDRCVRVWVDRKTGALMQAEELKDGKAVRRLWGTRIKKFGDRWMANVLEVETLGSGHRTKITVEEMK